MDIKHTFTKYYDAYNSWLALDSFGLVSSVEKLFADSKRHSDKIFSYKIEGDFIGNYGQKVQGNYVILDNGNKGENLHTMCQIKDMIMV